MRNIKIISDPFHKQIVFQKQHPVTNQWENISFESNPDSRLVKKDLLEGVFLFQLQDIIETLLEEYDDGAGIDLFFEGNSDEYQELAAFIQTSYPSSIFLQPSSQVLQNAREILPSVLTIFEKTQCILPEELEQDVTLRKFKDATQPQIPLIVVGNYSSGKSTLINALVGYELLPASDQPMTAKVIQVEQVTGSGVEIEICLSDQFVRIGIDDQDIVVEGDLEVTALLTAVQAMKAKSPHLSAKELASFVLAYLNDQEEIGLDLICVRTAFATSPMSRSSNNYVIFDTPGSNSSTHTEHLDILRKAMKGMSNGLPIFVSEYSSLDTLDNATLYQELGEIDGIDLRFTLLVVNKADTAALSTFQDSQVLHQILPRKLATKRIYFLSSLMGLGAKTNGYFQESDYERVYRKNIAEFSDPSNPYYQQLYQYNILPSQQKREQNQQAEQVGDLLYANSGLFSLESEIEVFGTKYAAYNKCLQADRYLKQIITQTQQIIQQSKRRIEQEKQRLEKKLEEEKQALLEELAQQQTAFYRESAIEYRQKMSEQVPQITPFVSSDVFAREREWMWEQASLDFKLQAFKKEKDEAPHNVVNKVVGGIEKAWNKKNIELLGQVIKSGFDGVGQAVSKQGAYQQAATQAKNQVKNQLLAYATTTYSSQIDQAASQFTAVSIAYWTEQATLVRERFSQVIGDATVLSNDKRTDIREIIFRFQHPVLNQDCNQLFHQKSLVAGFRLGDILLFGDQNKIDIHKLTRHYNRLLQEASSHILHQLSYHHQETFHQWVTDLLEKVHKNIIEFSPDLHSTNLLIQDNKMQIVILTEKLQQLQEYAQELDGLMAWKKDEVVTNGY